MLVLCLNLFLELIESIVLSQTEMQVQRLLLGQGLLVVEVVLVSCLMLEFLALV